jgi:WD40 repeat protein
MKAPVRLLANCVRPVSTAPGGVQAKHSLALTHNSHYFAYAAASCVFVFQLPSFTVTDTVGIRNSSICCVRLSPVRFTELSFLTRTREFIQYDFKTRTRGLHLNLVRMDFFERFEYHQNGNFVTLFSSATPEQATIDLETGHSRFSNIIGTFFLFFAPHPELPHVGLGIDGSRIVWAIVEENGNARTGSQIRNSYWLAYDPLNTMNCLSVGFCPTWVLFSFLPDFNVISMASRDDIVSHSGDWIPALPGHVVTGDSSHGILHVWGVASGDIVDTIELEGSPVAAVLRINDRHFVVAFEDGSVGVVDILQKGYSSRMNSSHINTIFNANVVPNDPNLLQTSAADGRACLWTLPSLEKKGNIAACDGGILMAGCLSPGGGYLATGSTPGMVTIVSLKTRQILFATKLHSAAVCSVAWSPHNPDIIASAGKDSHCVFYDIKQRKVVTTVSVKGRLRRIQFSRHEDMIAMACADGSVYIRLDGGAYFVIPGSEAPLFEVQWSPFNKQKLAATDDKGGVIVFDIVTKQASRAVGHDCARALVWSEAIDYLLISGGCDGRIIMWDARNLGRLGTIEAHMGHIYTLTTHPDRAFQFVSASRDETIRVWSLEALFPEKLIEHVLKGDRLTSEKVANYEGGAELTKLLHRITKDGVRLVFNDGDLCHVNDVLRLAHKRVQRMTATLPSDQSALRRAKKSRQTAIDAADLALKSGDVKRYCELMFIAGEFDLALAAAPAVSYNFWQNLMTARAELEKGTEEGADLTLIAGKPKEAIGQLVALKKFDSAMLIAASMRTCPFTPRTKSVAVKPAEVKDLPFIRTDFNLAEDFGTYLVASKRSLKFAIEGKPLMSAACLLTVGDVNAAAWRLLHCGELIWAIEVNRCSDQPDSRISDVFAKYAVVHGCAEQIFPTLSTTTKRKMIPLIPFKNDEQRNTFYGRHGMKTATDYLMEAKKVRGFPRALFLVLAGKVTEAAAYAVQCLKTLFSVPSFDFTEAYKFVELVQDVYVDDLTVDPIWKQVVALSYYFALYNAMWRRYAPIVESLVSAFETVVKEADIDWLRPRIPEVKLAAVLTVAAWKLEEGKELAQRFNVMVEFEGLADSFAVDGGSTVKPRSMGVVPVDLSQVDLRSAVSGTTIIGGAFVLEDEKSTIAWEEALMWFSLTPFSPLPTHAKLMAF